MDISLYAVEFRAFILAKWVKHCCYLYARDEERAKEMLRNHFTYIEIEFDSITKQPYEEGIILYFEY